MIAASLVFALSIGTLLGGAAYMLEKIAGYFSLPRRLIWTGGILLSWFLPIAMIVNPSHPHYIPTAALLDAIHADPDFVASGGQLLQRASSIVFTAHWPIQPSLDKEIMIAWSISSLVLVLLWGASMYRLWRQMKRWPVARIEGESVSISDFIGPAVFGVLRPRVVIPSGLLGQSRLVQVIALKHERSHIDAQDPALLAATTLLALLAPWNVVLAIAPAAFCD